MSNYGNNDDMIKTEPSRISHHRWLDAYSDPRASIYTFSRCMSLSDLHSDGDYKLIMADLGTGSSNIKLKVYKGTSLMTETTLLEIPTGLVTFYNDYREPKLPAIALASGPNVYVYKNMKPYFKFTLPNLEVNALEMDLWIQARNDEMEPKLLQSMLENVRNEVGYSSMSVQSQQLLSVSADNEVELLNIVKMHTGQPIKRQTVITCMTTLYKSTNTHDSISCIVLGTENGFIYIIDTEAFTILDSVNQSESNATDQTIPVVIKTLGLYDVDYRIVTYNRDGKITLLRRGWTQTKVIINLPVQAVDMCLVSETGNILVANMHMALECYSKKGRKLWDLKLSSNAMSLLSVPLPHQGITLTAVALNGGVICFYNGRQLVDTLVAADTIAGMIFGRFGQEEHCLILVTVGGTLQVKMLKRTALFSSHSITPSANISNQNIKLQIPKKTKLFLEQAVREKESALRIHQTFQRDLYRFRLETARSFADSLRKTNNLISNNSQLPLKLSAQVFGLGPTFKIQLTLENMAPTSENMDVLVAKKLGIVFYYNDKMYEVEKPYVHVPLLVPGLSYKFETAVRTTTDIMVSDEIHVFIAATNESKPVLSAVIYMPVCDVLPIEI